MNKYKIEEILSNIQFQVYSDMNFIEPLGLDKETWKELLEYINKQKELLDKIKEYINNYDVFKEFSFPLMKREEENQVKSSIDYQFNHDIKKDILELLEEIE